MTQELLDLGPLPPTTRPSAGATVVATRPALGRCVLKVRGVHALAITADRIEVLARARARGEPIPRTKPTTLAYGEFHVISRGPQMTATTADCANAAKPMLDAITSPTIRNSLRVAVSDSLPDA